MKIIFLFSLAVLLSTGLQAQEPETEQHKQMAAQMGQYMDQMWDTAPEDGKANIRLLFLRDGKPSAGKVSLQGRFKLIATGSGQINTALNPNANGRYVLEGLNPATWKLQITGQFENEGFSWNKETIKLESGDSPLIEVLLD